MSIGDQVAREEIELGKKAVETTARNINKVVMPAGRAVAAGTKAGVKTSVKGVCLVIKAGAFTLETLMAAVKACQFMKSNNLKYSPRNISINQLKKSGKVSVVSDSITEENMKYFDKYCKDFGIKYSAMKDERDSSDPKYIMFFESKDTESVMKALQEGYKDFEKARAAGKDKMQGEEAKSEERDSVVGKLFSFRSRVKHRDELNKEADKLKTQEHTEMSR